jgi:hypothetical protein
MREVIRKLGDHCARMQGLLIFYSVGWVRAAGLGRVVVERVVR